MRRNVLEKLLSVPEAAQVLSVSCGWIYAATSGRKIKFFKIGGAVRFRESDLIAYLESCTVSPEGED